MAVLVFILGLVFGSFYNVVIYRVPLEKSIINGRSACPNCSHVLGALELIPLLSIVIQGFKCKHCKVPISPRYFIVELLTGTLWWGAYLFFIDQGIWMVISACLLISLGIIVGYIDFDTHFISDIVLLIFLVGRLSLIWLTGESYLETICSMLVALVVYGAIYWLAKFYYKQEAFGPGDITYLITLGSWFRPLDIALVAIGSFFIAGLLLLVITFIAKLKFDAKKEIPFGPAMSIMAILFYFWGDYIKELYIQWVF
ncbi:prepilin peptidase [Streptococcus gallinaceus]|uniref:Leader peptidase (Prepilin peptidase)/N-methyltransferase n=1 Tax=Streptococcus gallinaceus TaxID=165758 RepID=A0ABV2JIE7_9STRE